MRSSVCAGCAAMQDAKQHGVCSSTYVGCIAVHAGCAAAVWDAQQCRALSSAGCAAAMGDAPHGPRARPAVYATRWCSEPPLRLSPRARAAGAVSGYPGMSLVGRQRLEWGLGRGVASLWRSRRGPGTGEACRAAVPVAREHPVAYWHPSWYTPAPPAFAVPRTSPLQTDAALVRSHHWHVYVGSLSLLVSLLQAWRYLHTSVQQLKSLHSVAVAELETYSPPCDNREPGGSEGI